MSTQSYTLGIMTMDVEGRDSEHFHAIVDAAVGHVNDTLADESRLSTQTVSFSGPHLTPGAGNYAPLDFLEIGLAEKLERRLPFLLIVTEVDLASSSLAYTLALPSRLTNVAVISTKRLSPEFWGEAPDADQAAARLAALMLHSFGHLVALDHHAEPTNIMFRPGEVEDLDRMTAFTHAQLDRISRTLPKEANDRWARDGKLGFALTTLVRDAGGIARAVV